MAQNFRLLTAGGASAVKRSRPTGPQSPLVTFSDSTAANTQEAESAYSIIIGNNGTGKSRLLGAIASEFTRIKQGGASGRGRKRPKLAVLDYAVDGEFVSGHDQAPGLPTRVIAVSLTPIDKFPLERSGDGDDFSREDVADLRGDASFYHYVGMRDRTNRASISALLYRALEGLGRKQSVENTARLRTVFELLGYQPRIRSKLKLALSQDVQDFLAGHRALIGGGDDTRLMQRIRALVDVGYDPVELRERLNRFTQTWGASTKNLELELDFSGDRPPPSFDVKTLRLLRRLGALSLATVEVWRADGTGHDLREASSGEIGVLTVFLSIAAHLRDGSLVLIDEPETSLHPEWQSKYIHLMREVFSGYSGCHFIFSTHSPHIVADIPAGSWIYSMDRAASVSSEELLGRSPDFVMANAFDVVGPTNYYLRDVLANALRLVGERQINSGEFKSQLIELERLAANMEGGAQVKQIVQDLQIAQAELAPDGD
jgi:predicted ATPase